MAAEPPTGGQRSLQVDWIAGTQATDGGAVERFGDGIDGKPAVRPLHDGETAAIHGDGRSEGHIVEHGRRLDDDATTVANLVDRPNGAEFLNDSREHVSRSLLRIRSPGGVAGADGTRRRPPRPTVTRRASGRDDDSASDVLSHPDSDRRPRTRT